MSEVAQLNMEQNVVSTVVDPVEIEPVIQKVLSRDENNETPFINSMNCSSQDLQLTNMSVSHEMIWNSYPDSLETALTTPEEKLKEVRETFLKQLKNANLITSARLSSISEQVTIFILF